MILKTRFLKPLLLLAGFALAVQGAMAADRLVTGGIVRGTDLPDGSHLFLGIPYAAPPVGDLRWKAPQPVPAWIGVRDATKTPPACIQHNETWNAFDAAHGQEDCLYLSIHAPRHDPSDRLPVLLWIHGGSNRAGSGAYVARDSTLYQQGVVVVALEYRLGVFGFLSSPELTAESPDHASGNYALMDQIAALRWIKDNIARFGGDPGNVTIGGQSAGAYDIALLLLSPQARGLFQKAIQESGELPPPRSIAENEKMGDDFAGLMAAPAADRLKFLRAASAESVLAMGDKLTTSQGVDPSLLWMQPQVDGFVLPKTPAQIVAEGGEARAPLIIGDNTQEVDLGLSPDTVRQRIETLFGANAAKALPLYGFTGTTAPADDPVLGNVGIQLVSDYAFHCATAKEADERLAARLPVWRYRFGVPQPGTKDVRHSAELHYVFDAVPPGASFGQWPPVQRYWADFMKSGNPDGPGLPHWPQMGAKKLYMAFTPDGPRIGADFRGAICRLLN
jgi:para-nitrobenzyl esterase